MPVEAVFLDNSLRPLPEINRNSAQESSVVDALEQLDSELSQLPARQSISSAQNETEFETEVELARTVEKQSVEEQQRTEIQTQLQLLDQVRSESDTSLALTVERQELDRRPRAITEFKQAEKVVIFGSLVLDIVA